jgi:predicted ATPase
VIQLSQGNPFFVEEWCNYIEDLPLDELKDIPVPANLYNLILSRLDKLPVSLRMMLHKAAVIGQEFFVEILRYMEKRLQDNLDVDATLKSLEDQSYILHSLGFDYSTYFFKHILTREVAYQTLLAENRKVLHRLCGEAIETLYPDRLDEFYYALAEHFHKAEVIDKAIIYIEKAANSAAKVYNNQQALRFYQLLLDYPDLQPVKRLEITMQIADIMWLTGDWNNALKIVYDLLHEAQKINAEKVCFEAYRFLGIAAFYQIEKMP